HGVKIVCNARIAGLVAHAGASPGTARVAAVRLADGSEVPADFVLVAIGVAATDALARDAGLDCDNGIVVNEFCQTSDASIWAAGDCASHPSIHFGTRVRL